MVKRFQWPQFCEHWTPFSHSRYLVSGYAGFCVTKFLISNVNTRFLRVGVCTRPDTRRPIRAITWSNGESWRNCAIRRSFVFDVIICWCNHEQNLAPSSCRQYTSFRGWRGWITKRRWDVDKGESAGGAPAFASRRLHFQSHVASSCSLGVMFEE